jgi:isopenicillin N synthase-like dioxygenase
MASPAQIYRYPAFPADALYSQLAKISLHKVAENDVHETQALFESCRSVGFFLLDLSENETGEALVKDVNALQGLAQLTMALPEEDKMRYHAKPAHSLFGQVC